MSEESILILNMLREGKISAEQADSLLRAVRTTGPQTPPPPPQAPPPPPSAPPADTATLAAMQAKLAELQSKLGDVQGKLGAAQAARAAGQAVSLAGKVLDHLPRPDVDMSKVSKAMDEALRGLNSLKNDAVRNAKVAARQASQEARKVAKQGGKAFGEMGFTITFNTDDGGEKRPGNAQSQPQATESADSAVTWGGADKLILHNPHGNLTIVGEDRTDNAASAQIVKTAWADSEADARVLLQQVFLTSATENGACKIAVVAPADAKDRLVVDVTLRVPNSVRMTAETTFGDIELDGATAHINAQTQSGSIRAHSTQDDSKSDAHFESRSGSVTLEHWSAPNSALSAETASGNARTENVTCQTVNVSTRSGDVFAQKVQSVGAALFEAVSGDVRVETGAFGGRAVVKAQSGSIYALAVRAEQIQMETVSGDAEVDGAAGTVTVKTVSGDARGKNHDGAASVSTVSGNVAWQAQAAFSGSLAATTVSGDIGLTLPADADTRIELNTASGELSCAVPLTEGTVSTERHMNGTLGAGVGSVKLQTASGDIDVAGV